MLSAQPTTAPGGGGGAVGSHWKANTSPARSDWPMAAAKSTMLSEWTIGTAISGLPVLSGGATRVEMARAAFEALTNAKAALVASAGPGTYASANERIPLDASEQKRLVCSAGTALRVSATTPPSESVMRPAVNDTHGQARHEHVP